MTSFNILITGASRGLGLALARTLASQGHSLILDARTPGPLAQAAEALRQVPRAGRILVLPGDIARSEHRLDLLAAAQSLGSLDVVINNASLLGPSPLPALLAYPLDRLEAVYRTNVLAPLALIQVLAPVLVESARILNLSSDAGVEAYAGWGGYGSSKAALDQLSAVLALEQPEWRVYAVDPGDMRTQMHQDAFPDEDISDRPEPEASVPGLLALISGHLPSGRYQARALSAAERVGI